MESLKKNKRKKVEGLRQERVVSIDTAMSELEEYYCMSALAIGLVKLKLELKLMKAWKIKVEGKKR